MFRFSLLAGAAWASTATVAIAQDSSPTPPQAPAQADPPAVPVPPDGADTAAAPAPDGNQDIVVTGFRQNRRDVLSGLSVVSGEALTRQLRPTIGETLARQPGVSSTAFGPNASRPILRGFQGDRIRILTDGIGSLDASSTSVDHAVAINPLTAQRIEVLRGPAALLFGSDAVGGVVNVIDARIPRRVPDAPIHVDGIAAYGSAANERSLNGAVDVPIGGHFVAHVDGDYSKTGDLGIGGHVLSPELRAEALASPDPAIRALADLKGRLPNSAGRTTDLAGALAWIDGASNAGVSINHFASLYGIPVRYPLDPSVEPEQSRIDLRQTRIDGRAEIDTGEGFIDSVRLRGGWSDYRHDERAADGAIGTSFFTKGYEGRLEAVQKTIGGFGGGFGVQYFHRDLRTVGDEKALPRNRTGQLGLFAVENYAHGNFRAEVGGRYERQTVRADADADIGNPDLERRYDAFSGSVGASYGPKAMRFGVNLSHTERAPGAEELFVNGPHPGTQAFEIGDPDLAREKSNGVELTLKGAGDGFSYGLSAYHLWFTDYVYEQATGAIEEGLPVFEQRQGDARYAGFEIEGSARLGRIGGFTLNADALADYVRATIAHVGPAPRIPPLRFLGGVEAQSDALNGRLEVEHVTRQDRVAELETPTKGYTMVNASLSWKPFRAKPSVDLTLSANNLFDVNVRRAASFLKDYAPLAGRDIRLSARFSF